jgi:DNA-binding phage protein
MDINKLRETLASRHGEWTRIAADAGVSRRTIYRIVNQKNSPNLQTLIDLDRALAEKSPENQAV